VREWKRAWGGGLKEETLSIAAGEALKVFVARNWGREWLSQGLRGKKAESGIQGGIVFGGVKEEGLRNLSWRVEVERGNKLEKRWGDAGRQWGIKEGVRGGWFWGGGVGFVERRPRCSLKGSILKKETNKMGRKRTEQEELPTKTPHKQHTK